MAGRRAPLGYLGRQFYEDRLEGGAEFAIDAVLARRALIPLTWAGVAYC